MSSTSSATHLDISLDTASGVPFYKQIVRGIERAVTTGCITGGERLPTIRALAVELKINPNTIAKAYAELELTGVVETQVGSGTYVSSRVPLATDGGREDAITRVVERALGDLAALGVMRDEVPALFANYKED